jgi:hypothetical protein
VKGQRGKVKGERGKVKAKKLTAGSLSALSSFNSVSAVRQKEKDHEDKKYL